MLIHARASLTSFSAAALPTVCYGMSGVALRPTATLDPRDPGSLVRVGAPARLAPFLPMQPLPKYLRPLLAILLIVALTLAVRMSGLAAWLERGHVQEIVGRAGVWGPLAFVALFVTAVVLQVPGLLFVAIAPALFSLREAWLLSVLASNLAVVLNFEIVRRIGGQPLAQIEAKGLRRLFARLDQHPVQTVALLRTVTVMFPPVTSALALTKLRARDHFIGSAVGMLLPITALVFATRFLVAR